MPGGVGGDRSGSLTAPIPMKDDEGHGSGNQESRFEFYRVVEQFRVGLV